MTELMHCDVCGHVPIDEGSIFACQNCGKYGFHKVWNQMITHSLCDQERALFMRLACVQPPTDVTDWPWVFTPNLSDIRRMVIDRYEYLGERAKSSG